MKEGHSAWCYVFLPFCSAEKMPTRSRNSTVFYHCCLEKGIEDVCKKNDLVMNYAINAG